MASRTDCHRQLEAQARAQVVTCLVSTSNIGSTEVALLMQGKVIISDFMINNKASKGNLLDSEIKYRLPTLRNSCLSQ